MTNAVDWVVATPNLGVEFDLAGNEKTRFSILMNGKYIGIPTIPYSRASCTT